MSIFQPSYKRRDGTSAKTSAFYVEFRDHMGRRRVVPGFADEVSSRDLNRRLVALVAAREAGQSLDDETRQWVRNLPPKLRRRLADFGLVDADLVASLRPLSELVDAWGEHLRARGATERHVRMVTRRALVVMGSSGASYLRDLNAARVEQFLRAERAQGTGFRTSNFHLSSTRQFLRWCIRLGFVTQDPLRAILPLNTALDRRRVRRALTTDEVRTLLEATEKGPPRHGNTGEPCADGMNGPERALVYRVAVETGLRRNELKTLSVADLELADREHAAVRVRADNAKNRRDAVLPLRPATARDLAVHVASRAPDAPVFSCLRDWQAAVVLRADLAAAGIPYTDAAGRVVDFHALRTTFGTALARAGVALQVAQRLMRHSSPALTSNIYTVLGREDERAAVAALPDLRRRRANRPQSRVSVAVTAASRRAVPRRDQQLLLDAAAAAAVLGMTDVAFRESDQRGDVPRALTLGSLQRWSRPELALWVQARCPARAAWEATNAQRPAQPTSTAATVGGPP
jgi:integrase